MILVHHHHRFSYYRRGVLAGHYRRLWEVQWEEFID